MRHCMSHRMSALSVTRVPPETEIYEAQKGLINQSIPTKIPVTLGNLWNPTLGGRTSDIGCAYWEGGTPQESILATSIAVVQKWGSL